MQLVLDSVRAVATYYPPWLREEVEGALPSLGLEATRLALEVMQAEQDGIPFAEAVRRIDFPLMSKVHFAIEDLLQHRVPNELRPIIRGLAAATKRGEFDELRRAVFAGASGGDPQGALLRFLIHEGNNIDVLVATWDLPEIEVLGALGRVETESQRMLYQRLAMPEMHAADIRPFHVMLADLIEYAVGDADAVARVLQERKEAVDLVLQLVEATRTVRGLDAPNAAVARAESFDADIGSQQLVDRYPWHFKSVNAVDQRRSRLRRDIAKGEPPLVLDGSRMIDLLLEEARKEDEKK
jgi:hypothetical protein